MGYGDGDIRFKWDNFKDEVPNMTDKDLLRRFVNMMSLRNINTVTSFKIDIAKKEILRRMGA